MISRSKRKDHNHIRYIREKYLQNTFSNIGSIVFSDGKSTEETNKHD